MDAWPSAGRVTTMKTLVLAVALLFAVAPVAAAAEVSLAPPAVSGIVDCTGPVCDAICALLAPVFRNCPIA